MTKTYQNRYSWTHVNDTDKGGVLHHKEGSISVGFRWNGIDTALKDSAVIQTFFNNIIDALQSTEADGNIVIENHFLRFYDDTVCRKYVEYGIKHSTRAQELSKKVREAQASTIGDMAMVSDVITIITLERRLTLADAIFSKKSVKNRNKKGSELLEKSWEFMSQFDGAKVLSKVELEASLWQYYHRELAREKQIPEPNDRFYLADRIASKPTWEDGLLKLGNTYTRVMLLLDYPDADTNWFSSIASFTGVELQVTQIVKPANLARALLKSSSQTKRSTESANTVGGESVMGKVNDHNAYRAFIAENDLHVFENAFIIKIHHPNADYVKEVSRTIVKSLGSKTVISPVREDISFAFWRCSQLGQGHKTPFKREDHTIQVANMFPCIKYSEGDTENRQMLRITNEGQAITLAYPNGGTNHAMTIAKTGSGKGVETVAQITELYPLGVNFYGAEVGSSYEWTVDACGGDYYHLEPDSVISPFPNYSMSSDNEDDPLSADIIAPTIGALLPLIGKGADKISQHVNSVAEQIMLELYKGRHDEDGAPTLDNFLECTKAGIDTFEGVQKESARVIKDNLDSFLSSSSGKNFKHADSLDFSAGMVFVDFKKLMNSPELAKFLLVFISLRFKQLAFANSTPTRIVLDELHEFASIDKKLISNLIRQLTRMGRKEAGAFHGITQETMDLDLDKGILNQITYRNFLYMQSGHNQTSDIFKMNDTVQNRWQSYKDPERLKFRQCMHLSGEDAYDLHLKFPHILLDLAHSSPEALAAKNEIGIQTQCTFERLAMFRERMGAA